LVAAIDDLIKLESESLDSLLTRLKEEDDDHYNNKVLPADIKKIPEKVFSDVVFHNVPEELFIDGKDENTDKALRESDIDFSLFFKGKSFCHTARLPSRIRYLGYLTDTDKVGGPGPFEKREYDIGIEKKEATDNYDFVTMPLVWESEKLDLPSCPVTVNPDKKDFFFSKGGHWNELLIPNKAEKKVYLNNGDDVNLLEGFVFPFFKGCDWGNCPDGFLQHKDLHDGKWEMKINGESVTQFVPVHGGDQGSYICKHAKGHTFPPDPDGNFKIEIRVKEETGYIELSSIAIF
jgi:hypothetical protein